MSTGSRCQGFFIEELEESENQIKDFSIPQFNQDGLVESASGLPQDIQDRLDQDQRNRRQNNARLVQNILDMALARIRSTNHEFRNATLTGA